MRRQPAAIGALLSALAALGVLLAWLERRAAGAGEDRGRSAAAAPSAGEPPSPSAPAVSKERRLPAAPVPALEQAPQPPFGALRARGRTIGPQGARIPGVAIGTMDDEPGSPSRAASGEDGLFELDLPSPWVTLVSVDPRWETVRGAEWLEEEPSRELTIVVAPAVELGGLVVDAGGRPLAGARSEILVSPEILSGFPVEETAGMEWRATSDERGRFLLARAPAVAGARLSTALTGYLPDCRELPLETQGELRVVLRPEARPFLEGAVVHADGSPAAGAVVRLQSERADVDALGLFRLAWKPTAPDAPLVATKRGFQPAILPALGRRLLDGPSPGPLRLVLGPPTVSIEGLVVSVDGTPLKGWRVQLLDATELEPGASSPALVEDLTGEGRHGVRTEHDGRFRIGGLSEREYSLRAWGGEPPLEIRSGPISAPRLDVRIEVPRPESRPFVRGRVLTGKDVPVEGARVALLVGGSGTKPGLRATTGEDGGFELQGCPGGWVELMATGEDILPVRCTLAPEDPPVGVVIHAVQVRRLRFENAERRDPPDALMALDRAGNALLLWRLEKGQRTSSTRVDLSGDSSGVLAVDERAEQLAVFRRGQELARIDLALTPGEVAPVRWP